MPAWSWGWRRDGLWADSGDASSSAVAARRGVMLVAREATGRESAGRQRIGEASDPRPRRLRSGNYLSLVPEPLGEAGFVWNFPRQAVTILGLPAGNGVDRAFP